MKQTLGNIHPKSAQVLADLATLKARQRKSVEAQQLLRRSIAVWRHMGAGSHPALLSALKKLTSLCSNQGKCRNSHVEKPINTACVNPLNVMQDGFCSGCIQHELYIARLIV